MNENDQAPPLLVAEQVRKVYRTGGVQVEALAGLDLEVRRGELVAVMGPSGSGKTTLLNCLSGLDDIDGGRVLVEGQDLFAMSDARRTTRSRPARASTWMPPVRYTFRTCSATSRGSAWPLSFTWAPRARGRLEEQPAPRPAPRPSGMPPEDPPASPCPAQGFPR